VARVVSPISHRREINLMDRSRIACGLGIAFFSVLTAPVLGETQKVIVCPDTRAKLNWADHAGSEPAFEVKDPSDKWVEFKAVKIFRGDMLKERNNQTIVCQYVQKGHNANDPNALKGVYKYRVRAEIKDCSHFTTPGGLPALNCKLK
jgi:hypothetical protein